MSTTADAGIGIIGAGNIGQAFARLASRAGRPVVLSHRRAPDELEPLARELGADVTAGTVAEAAAASMVVLAVPWSAIPDAVSDLDLDGRVVVDTTNAMNVSVVDGVPTFAPIELHGRTSSEVVADLVAGARVVKAGNTLLAATLAADPRVAGGHRVLFLSGDDEQAKAEVAGLFLASGFSPVDLGGLAEGGRMQQMLTGPLAGLDLVRLR